MTELLSAVNDATAYGVAVKPCDAPLGSWYWRCIRVHHLSGSENRGNHHFFLDVLDEFGRRINAAKIKVWWGPTLSESAVCVIDKPANEPGTNAPLWAGQVLNACVIDEPILSDVVMGVSTAHPDEEAGNTNGHHSFLVVWQRTYAGPGTDPGPDPEPPTTTPPSSPLLMFVASSLVTAQFYDQDGVWTLEYHTVLKAASMAPRLDHTAAT